MKSANLHQNQVCAHALPPSMLQRFSETLVAWQRRARERAELARFDPWMQRDLGLSQDDIWREARKARWQQ